MRDLRDVLSILPKQRRTGLFSATLDKIDKKSLQKFGLRNPALITLKKSNEKKDSDEKQFTIPNQLGNYFLILPSRLQKISYLIQFLIQNQAQKLIIFFNTCSSVEFYSKLIRTTLQSHYHYPSAAKKILHLFGKMKQKKRSKVFSRFDKMSEGVLVTTDVAGRGADFGGVDWVVQVDPPQSPEFFVHRVGRTARSGREGRALVLLEKGEKEFVGFLRGKGVEMRWVGEIGGQFRFGNLEIERESKSSHNNKNNIDNENNKQESGKNNISNTNKKDTQPKQINSLKSSQMERHLKLCKSTILTDRDFHVKSLKAFISHIRSFKEHRLRSIFNISTLDLHQTAKSFFLGRIPLIKETKSLLSGTENLILDQSYNEKLKILKFKDKNQAEQYRQKNLKLENKKKIEKEKKNKLRKRAFKESGLKKRKGGRSFQERKRAKDRAVQQDFDDFAEEERLYKKVKQGKMTQDEFDRIVNGKETRMQKK